MHLETFSIRYDGQTVDLIDQTQLPHSEVWVHCKTPEDMFQAIQKLQVRGAPLIGVAAGLSLALYSKSEPSVEKFIDTAKWLRTSRPTAVNLMYVIDKIIKYVEDSSSIDGVETMAISIFNEDQDLCRKIATNGATVINDGDQVLTHCNTGGLATAGVGTALGVISEAHRQGKKIHVFVDETRPLLQGGRLTTWELEKLEIPYTLICDNMAAALFQSGKIDKAIVGADRIATNGDFANKIGTLNVALLCHHFKKEFYTAAPYTTIDRDCENGSLIDIEQRKPEEVQGVNGSFGQCLWAPKTAKVFNPAFDVTPAEYVTGWITEEKVFSAPQF